MTATVTDRRKPPISKPGVRCPTCTRQLALDLRGTLVVTCRHCKQTHTITR